MGVGGRGGGGRREENTTKLTKGFIVCMSTLKGRLPLLPLLPNMVHKLSSVKMTSIELMTSDLKEALQNHSNAQP